MARFLMADDPVDESVEALEEANNLITPIMNYIRDAKRAESVRYVADMFQNGQGLKLRRPQRPPL
jgi:hypothetical protein